MLDHLGRATAEAHRVSDTYADAALVHGETEGAIAASLDGKEYDFTDRCTRFAHRYAAQVRADHALSVDAFRNNAITGVRSSDPV